MRNFVIDVDEGLCLHRCYRNKAHANPDMNGMLVNREEEHLTKDDLAFVVHDARRYTDNALGFDVIRKNIPAVGINSPISIQSLTAIVGMDLSSRKVWPRCPVAYTV